MDSTSKKRKPQPNALLRRERDSQNWTLQEVADKLYDLCAKEGRESGISADTVGRWERGVSKPEAHYRAKLCTLFSKNAKELGFFDQSDTDDPNEDADEESSRVTNTPSEKFLTPLAPLVNGTELDGHRSIQLLIPKHVPHVVIHIHQQEAPVTTGMFSQQSDIIDNTTLATNFSTPALSDQQNSVGNIFGLGILALALAQQQHGWTLEELQFRSLQELRKLDDMTQQQGGMTSRRQALKFLMGIPAAIFGLTYSNDTASLLPIAEEILPLYAASVPASWNLYYSGPNEWVEIERILPAYISHLTPLAQQSSKYQKAAASLLSQTHQLEAEITLTREDFNTSLTHCKQAFLYAQIAGDANLQAASLIREANTLFHRNRSTIQINQQAAQYVHGASPLLQGRIYSELSTTYAELGQEQEAYRYTGLAHDCTPDQPEDDPVFSYTHSDHYILYFNDMWTYLRLDQPQKAWEAITKAGTFLPEIVTPRRMELLRHFVITATALGDLDLSKAQFETLVEATSTFGSDLHFSELYNTHQLMLAKWPNERRVKALAELYQ